MSKLSSDDISRLVAGILIAIGQIGVLALMWNSHIESETGIALISIIITGAVAYLFQNKQAETTRNTIDQTAKAVTNGAATAAVARAQEALNTNRTSTLT